MTELQDYADRITLALDASRMGLWDWDLKSGQITWNRQHELILGYEAGNPQRSYEEWAERVEPEDLEKVNALICKALDEKIEYRCEYRLRLPAGEVRWVRGVGRGYYDEHSNPVRMIGVLMDITLYKQAELAAEQRAEELDWKTRLLTQTTALLRQRNQELDRFAYAVSHDLKAPLRAIANLSEWIEEDLAEQLSGSSAHQMRLLRQRVRRMESLIEDLLAYSRAGRVYTDPEMISIQILLEEIIESLGPPPGFLIIVDPDMPVLKARRVPMIQVFSNLIVNAVKHHGASSEKATIGKIRISVQKQDDRYKFAVSDDGQGIAPRDHQRIFEVFQTASCSAPPESTGIGLAIVKKIVEAEGGHIWVESELGQGTTFYFTWLCQPQTDIGNL